MLSHRVPLALPKIKPALYSYCPVALNKCFVCNDVQSTFEFTWRRFKDRRPRRLNRCKKCKRAYEKAYEQKRRMSPNLDLRYAKHRAYMATEKGQRLAKRAEYKRKMDATRQARKAERSRSGRIFKAYGITEEQYAEMLKNQHGVCGICRELPKQKALFVDHCHSTGKVRGLLCVNCNLAIGCLKDDPTRIQSALEYVLRHQPPAPAAAACLEF